MTLTRTEVRDLLDRYQISPKRSLGQNFVVEPNTVRRIAELAEIETGDQVLEIGPGVGSLTLALLDQGAQVTVIEIDDKLIEVLKEVTADKQVKILHEDAMNFEFDNHFASGEWKLVANLPYNISVPLICNILDTTPSINEMLVMVQSEVADRLVASPGTKTYGFPSVKISFYAEASVVSRVPPSVFLPRPRVDSAIVKIKRHSRITNEVNKEILFSLVRAGFAHRRKTLRRSLGVMVTEEEFKKSNINSKARAEELNIDEWIGLAREVQS
ncbi:MAG TPA: 16S rRNA (adenine(1518)-N(6)/adenine(1519)-N(6))-dimethyltransferase RsmA [Acidimicrobiales bacterium]|nr:16S rRNA (adenine(1518)-N(6)/adenine(1519)-N(6))-dimethyltransferase RsmA [Acidimicrobiales bacterium]|tara:strand:- start:961 stop:1773 length:813 start_codon:yes stop_codon:yes gene_type:complete